VALHEEVRLSFNRSGPCAREKLEGLHPGDFLA
jgi:hypothetical protein